MGNYLSWNPSAMCMGREQVVLLLPGKTEFSSFTDFRNHSSLTVSVGRNPLQFQLTPTLIPTSAMVPEKNYRGTATGALYHQEILLMPRSFNKPYY